MNIVIFAPDMPYPPNRGGRADIWRRIGAMVSLGHSVMLVYPVGVNESSPPSASDVAYVDSVVAKRFSFSIKRGLLITIRQLAKSWLVPWHAATRTPNVVEKQALLHSFETFKPDLIWLDGPWFGVVGRELSEHFSVPIAYRSHNIEHHYLWGQAKAAVRYRDRLAWSLVCIGLRRFEFKTMQSASAVFDISVDDIRYWAGVGVKGSHWLPPLPQLALEPRPTTQIAGEIVFLGNLGTPNNVRGVEWLVTKVLPLVLAKLPHAKLRIVGSNPTSFISVLLMGATGVALNVNVPDPTPYLFGAKVLVNPVMTGSGVQVKMLDMLMTDAPIVTTTQGTRGLPDSFKGLFRIADDAALFAQAICEELARSTVDKAARAQARNTFSVAAVEQALAIAKKSLV